jgi:hypothetical protein
MSWKPPKPRRFYVPESPLLTHFAGVVSDPGDLAAILGIAKMGYRTVAIARGSDKEPLARKLGARHYIEGDQNSADDRNHAA